MKLVWAARQSFEQALHKVRKASRHSHSACSWDELCSHSAWSLEELLQDLRQASFVTFCAVLL